MIVRSKKEFRNYVLKMMHPVLESTDCGNWYDNLSTTCIIHDKNNVGMRFILPTVTLKRGTGDITQDDIDSYYTRERKSFIKYERWLHEFCGNYCTSKLKISSNKKKFEKKD